MKILIVGRTASGKNAFADKLVAKGYTRLKSCTTRPRRKPDENDYIYLTADEAAKTPVKIAPTVINGYEYFTTPEQVEKHDIYIVEPEGVYALLKTMPETDFCIVYIKPAAGDDAEATRQKFVAARSDDPAKAMADYNNRCQSENDRFTAFEERLAKNEPLADNALMVYQWENDYVEASLNRTIEELIGFFNLQHHTHMIVEQLMHEGIIKTMGDKVALRLPEGPVLATAENVAMRALGQPDFFNDIMKTWLSLHAPAGEKLFIDPDDQQECMSETCAFVNDKGICCCHAVTGRKPDIGTQYDAGCSEYVDDPRKTGGN